MNSRSVLSLKRSSIEMRGTNKGQTFLWSNHCRNNFLHSAPPKSSWRGTYFTKELSVLVKIFPGCSFAKGKYLSLLGLNQREKVWSQMWRSIGQLHFRFYPLLCIENLVAVSHMGLNSKAGSGNSLIQQFCSSCWVHQFLYTLTESQSDSQIVLFCAKSWILGDSSFMQQLVHAG